MIVWRAPRRSELRRGAGSGLRMRSGRLQALLEDASIPCGSRFCRSLRPIFARLARAVYVSANLKTGWRAIPEQQRKMRAIRLLALWKPNERRVMVRIFPFMPSVRPLLSRSGM